MSYLYKRNFIVSDKEYDEKTDHYYEPKAFDEDSESEYESESDSSSESEDESECEYETESGSDDEETPEYDEKNDINFNVKRDMLENDIDDDFIDPRDKLYFFAKYNNNTLPQNSIQRCYLVKMKTYKLGNIWLYKVGYTDLPLQKKLENLSGQYGCNYKIHLINYFEIVNHCAEYHFHNDNRDILYVPKIDLFKKYNEVYKNPIIIERFNKYKVDYLEI
jgi:hypothetical protein